MSPTTDGRIGREMAHRQLMFYEHILLRDDKFVRVLWFLLIFKTTDYRRLFLCLQPVIT